MSELPPAPAPAVYPTPGSVLAAAPRAPGRMDLRRALVLAGVVTLMALGGIGVVVYVGSKIGPVALAVGIGAAILPVPLLVLCFLWLDRYEPEPVKYLAFCFGWGAGVATAASLAVNNGAAYLFPRMGLPDELVGVLVAPFIEESMKALGPVLLFVFARRAFSGALDGIVYCGLSATGFAMVENILYLGGFGYARAAHQAGALAGFGAVAVLFFVRIVMTGFAHPLFTAMTGIGLGVGARTADRWVRWCAPLAGLLVAMMLHGTWNLMVTVADTTDQPLVLLCGYIAVMVPIFLGMVGFTLWLRGGQGRLTERVLGEYARAGWFSPPEVATMGTVGRRLSARRWARRTTGHHGATAMRAYQFEATKLALLRDGIRRGLGTAPDEIHETLAEERRLLDAIVAYRQVFTGRDPFAAPARWDGAHYQLILPDGSLRSLDPPEQPVVPVAVVLAPVRAPAYGYPYR